jgi:hypothetical protein
VVAGTAGSSFDYAIRLNLPVTTTTPYTLGQRIDGAIANAGDAAWYAFTGSPGQSVFFEGLSTANGFNVSLVSPSGQTVLSSSTASYNQPVVLHESGIYTLKVTAPVATPTGSFSFRLVDVATVSALSTFPTLLSGTLTPGDPGVLSVVQAMPGQRLDFTGTKGGSGGTYQLYDPLGNFVTSGSFSGSNEAALKGGTYLVYFRVNGSSSVDYGLNLSLGNTNTKALMLGSTTSGTIVNAGDRADYMFTGTKGQVVLFDGQLGGGLLADLVGPAGDVTNLVGDLRNDSSPVLLQEAGTYQVLIRANSAGDTGDYRFQLFDAARQPLVSTFSATLSGTLTQGGASTLMRVQGNAGDRLFIEGLSGSTGTYHLYALDRSSLFPTNGSIFADEQLNQGNEYALPGTGEYLLVIANNSAGDLAYKLRLDKAQTVATAYKLNSLVTATIANAGDRADYTFSASAGQALFFDGIAGPSGLIARLLAPSGKQLNYNALNADAGPLTLTETGTYILEIDGRSAPVTGDYSFRILNAPDQQVVATPTVIQNSTVGGLATDLYRFEGAAGQKLVLEGLAGGASADFEVFAPFNISQGGTSLSSFQSYTLPATGEYLTAVRGRGATAFTYRLAVRTAQTPSTPYTFGTAVSDVIANDGDSHDYTFSGAVGQRLVLQQLTGFAALIAPDGTSQTYFSGLNDLPQLVETGTYTLHFGTKGAYGFRLDSLDAQPEILGGGVFTVTLSAPSAVVVQVPFSTKDGTAIAGTDYVAKSGTVLFNPGETVQEIKVVALANPNHAGDVSFTVNLVILEGAVPFQPDGTFGIGASYTHSLDFALPRGVSGTYYVFVVTNPPPGLSGNNADLLNTFASSAYETDYSNNYQSAAVSVTYREPDLTVTAFSSSATAVYSGQTVHLKWTVQNIGTRDVRDDEQSWVDTVYLSRDPALEPDSWLLHSAPHSGGLKMGASYDQQMDVQIPDGIEGSYYLIVYTNAYIGKAQILGPLGQGLDIPAPSGSNAKLGAVGEYRDYGNNLSALAVQVKLAPLPDLQVTAVDVPQKAVAGQTFHLHFTVANLGQGDVPQSQGTWDTVVYLSTDTFLDTSSARFLMTYTHSGGLAAGDHFDITDDLRLPNNLVGSYYVYVITDPADRLNASDPFGTVFEGGGANDFNNDRHSAQPLIIEKAPPGDLEVIGPSITVPPPAQTGDMVTISWTVANNGPNAISGSWSDAAYLSTSPTWDINAIPLGKAPVTEQSLGVGGTYTASIQAKIPPVLPGSYRIIVRPDIFQETSEVPGKGNRATASADLFTVTVPALRRRCRRRGACGLRGSRSRRGASASAASRGSCATGRRRTRASCAPAAAARPA